MPGKKREPFPTRVAPMLATLIKEPFDDPDWVYEVKWDGFRILAYVQDGKATLYSREYQDYTSRFRIIADELKRLPDCILDGEIVVLDENGKPDFSALQNYQGTGDIAFYIFDILYLDGESYLNRTLLQRKEMLLHVVTKARHLNYSDHYNQGTALFDQVTRLDLEGIIAKRKDSLYQPGKRSKDWLKVKIKQSREYVIGGWSTDDPRTFKTILFGEYVNGAFFYVHHSGGGYTSKQRGELFLKMKLLETSKCPFVNPNDVIVDTTPHWCRPQLVAEFEISNKTTKAGIIRHPAIFKGLREDKRATALAQEKVEAIAVPSGSWETVLKRPINSKETLEVDGRKIMLNNIEHQFWKDVSKADIIRYYINIAEYLLPYLKDRPLGINISQYDPKESFFLRGMEGHAPKWATIFKTDRKHKKEGKSDMIEWLVCNDLATLVWIVNLDCIDMHPWGSRTSTPNTPDYIGIDLDPSDNDFRKVVDTSLAAKELFDSLKIKSFVKTSGKSGMHIYLPCIGIEYGQARIIAENICVAIHKLAPGITTTDTTVSSRGNKLYIDPSQNDYGDRLAAPYCIRANELPTVSTPLNWKEVKVGLDPAKFNIHTIMKRLDKKGDSWDGLLNKQVAFKNSKVLTKFLI